MAGKSKVVGAVGDALSGAPKALKRLFFGGGEEAVRAANKAKDGVPYNKLTNSWGAIDDDLWDARRLQGDLKSIGFKVDPKSLGISADGTDIDLKRIEALLGSDALKGMGLFSRGEGSIEKGIKQFSNIGLDLSPEQYVKLRGRRKGLYGVGRSVKDFVIGQSPFAVTKERFLQGGIFGKGGLATGDVTLGKGVRRNYDLAKEEFKNKEYGSAALRMGSGVALPVAAQGLNAGFTYGLPAAAVYDAVTDSDPNLTTGNRVRRLGASLTSSVGSVALAPLGLAQLPALEYMDKGINAAWGYKPGSPGRGVANRVGGANSKQTGVVRSAVTTAKSLRPTGGGRLGLRPKGLPMGSSINASLNRS